MEKMFTVSDGILWLRDGDCVEYIELIKVGDKVQDPHLRQKFGQKKWDRRMMRYVACLANETAGYEPGKGRRCIQTEY